MFTRSPVDPCYNPELPGQQPDDRKDSPECVYTDQTQFGFKIQAFVDPDVPEIVIDSDSHEPIGSIPGIVVRISSPDDSDGFAINGEDVRLLILRLEHAEKLYRAHQQGVARNL